MNRMSIPTVIMPFHGRKSEKCAELLEDVHLRVLQTEMGLEDENNKLLLRTRILKANCKERALQFYQTLSPYILRDLEQICEAFNTQFPARQGVEISKNALRRLMKLRQTEGESVKAYIERTLAIKGEVTHPTYLDLLTESFINGL
jgi:hypothetical protein